MTEGATNEVLHLSNDQINDVLQQFANGFGQVRRSPVMRLPSGQGLDYQNGTFPSRARVPLVGWFIPAPRSAQPIPPTPPPAFPPPPPPPPFAPRPPPRPS